MVMVFILPRTRSNPHFVLRRAFNLCFKSLSSIPNKEHADTSLPSSQHSSTLHLSPFFSDVNHPSTGYDIQLVDRDAWGVSSGVTQAWRPRPSSFAHQLIDQALDSHPSRVESDLDFEAIDNMRVRGDLFYKLERSSKEFEEYSFEFHRKKSSKKETAAKASPNVASKEENYPKVVQVTRSKTVISRLDEMNDIPSVNKRLRNPTFNQLTGPYHEPFCLDIYISNASVRACIVHRVTSKVVAVAHSISKDIKFDLASTKNKTTCAAVGAILAHRALADDIHDVIYTPRKGERLEGKLQIVLQSIIHSGINVKVKIKQRPK